MVNLEKTRFETREFAELLGEEWMPGLEEVVSVFENGLLRRPVGTFFTADPKDLIVTFDRWVSDTQHPTELRWILQTLEKAYGQPVDIEYAFDGEHFHLLQCRSLNPAVVLRGSFWIAMSIWARNLSSASCSEINAVSPTRSTM